MKYEQTFNAGVADVVAQRITWDEFFQRYSSRFDARGRYVHNRWLNYYTTEEAEDLAQEARVAALERLRPNVVAMIEEVGVVSGDLGAVECPKCGGGTVTVCLDGSSSRFGDWACDGCGVGGGHADLALMLYVRAPSGEVVPMVSAPDGSVPLTHEELWSIRHYKAWYNPNRLRRNGKRIGAHEYAEYGMGDRPMKRIKRAIHFNKDTKHGYLEVPSYCVTTMRARDGGEDAAADGPTGSKVAEVLSSPRDPTWGDLPPDYLIRARAAVMAVDGATDAERAAVVEVVRLLADGVEYERAVGAAAAAINVDTRNLRCIIATITGDKERRRDATAPVVYDPLAFLEGSNEEYEPIMSDTGMTIIDNLHDDEVEELRACESSHKAVEIARRCYHRVVNSHYDLAHLLSVARDTKIWEKDDAYNNFEDFARRGMLVDRGYDTLRKMVDAYKVVQGVAEEYGKDPRELWALGYSKFYALRSVPDAETRRLLITSILDGAGHRDIVDQKAAASASSVAGDETDHDVEGEDVVEVLPGPPPDDDDDGGYDTHVLDKDGPAILRVYVSMPEDQDVPVPCREIATNEVVRGYPLDKIAETYCEFAASEREAIQIAFDVRDGRFFGVQLVARRRQKRFD